MSDSLKPKMLIHTNSACNCRYPGRDKYNPGNKYVDSKFSKTASHLPGADLHFAGTAEQFLD